MSAPGTDGGRQVHVEQRPGGLLAACFTAMASPCEVLVQTRDESLAARLGTLASREAWRIEAKYSRYRADSVLSRLNHSPGQPQTLDPETVGLIEFARECHESSGGLFDITSGVLRRAWTFDGGSTVPAAETLSALCRHVGFQLLEWQAPVLTVPDGMELDLGGIGKEYAVDRALALCAATTDVPVLVNFGGDLACRDAPDTGPWQIGVERPASLGDAAFVLELGSSGGLATSGDTHRFVMHQGRRLGHILNPRTGWPVEGGPASVTVAAGSCLEAGSLATFALLEGAGAREFLDEQGVRYWMLEG